MFLCIYVFDLEINKSSFPYIMPNLSLVLFVQLTQSSVIFKEEISGV